MKSKLAVTTLEDNAAAWWASRMQQQPRLIVTYDQLLELLKCKLAPSAATAASYEAWCNLSYDSDLERFMTTLTKLLLQYPLEPDTTCVMAARPFGPELRSRLSAMNAMYKPNGMSIPEIKEQIRNFVLERESSPNFAGWKGSFRHSQPRPLCLRNVQINDSPPKAPPPKAIKPRVPPTLHSDPPSPETRFPPTRNIPETTPTLPKSTPHPSMAMVPRPVMYAAVGNTRGYSALRRKEANVLFVVPQLTPHASALKGTILAPKPIYTLPRSRPRFGQATTSSLRTCLIQTWRTWTGKKQKRQKKNIMWTRWELQTYMARTFV